MTAVKICGITNLVDALAAVQAGVDMLGYNFYRRSPRYIDPATCATIQAGLRLGGRRITTIGVFVNAPLAEIESVMDGCGLDLAQLHGDEEPAVLAALDHRAYKAVRPVNLPEARASLARYAPDPARTPALLVDAVRRGQYGGTGQVSNWDLAHTLAADYPILLAGGLHPANVTAAVEQVQPWAVDVASGVETAPGIKDHAAMAAFVAAVRAADPDRQRR